MGIFVLILNDNSTYIIEECGEGIEDIDGLFS